MPNTGTADVGIAIADQIAITLEARDELRVVALDFRGAFDRVWWWGLLAHLWGTVGVRGSTFKLISNYLSEWSFMVVTNGERSERYQIHSGVPQEGIWSPLLFDLFVRKLPQQVQHAAMLCYADDTILLMRIPTGHREMCAALLNSDMESLLNYGKSWLLELEVKKTQALTVSRKHDPNKNPPLVMDGIPIAESKTLKILGYTFDSKGLCIVCTYWTGCKRSLPEARCYQSSQTVPQGWWGLHNIQSLRAFKLEYGNLIYWSAAETHLAKLDRIQQQAQRLFEGVAVPPLEQKNSRYRTNMPAYAGNVKQPLNISLLKWGIQMKTNSEGWFD